MGSFDFCVAIAFQVLEHVNEVILSGIGHILNPDSGTVSAFKVVQFHRDRRGAGIIDGRTGNLITAGLRGGRGCDGVGQLMCLYLQKVGVEDDFIAAVIHVIILRSNVINVNRAEDGDNGHVASDNRFCRYLSLRSLNNPLLENLAGNEGFLRHGSDSFVFSAEVLGEALFRLVIFHNDEIDSVFVFECSCERKVGSDLLNARILRFTYEPTSELFAFHDRGCGEGKGIAVVIGVDFIGVIFVASAFDFIGDGKYVLLVFSPYVHIRINRDAVGEVADLVAVLIDPLASVAGLFRHGGNVIQAVGIGSYHCLGTYDSGFVFLIEGNRIFDVSIFGADGYIFGGNIGSINRGSTRYPFALYALTRDRTNHPLDSVAVSCDQSTIRHSAERLIDDDIALLQLLRISVVEGDLIGIFTNDELRGKGRILRAFRNLRLKEIGV